MNTHKQVQVESKQEMIATATDVEVVEQEPVAWIIEHPDWGGSDPVFEKCIAERYESDKPGSTIPLYLHPQPAPTHPQFCQDVIEKLIRFAECADDGQGVDIGRQWLDTLTHLGLLERVQRSPAWWQMTQQGAHVLAAYRHCR